MSQNTHNKKSHCKTTAEKKSLRVKKLRAESYSHEIDIEIFLWKYNYHIKAFIEIKK